MLKYFSRIEPRREQYEVMKVQKLKTTLPSGWYSSQTNKKSTKHLMDIYLIFQQNFIGL